MLVIPDTHFPFVDKRRLGLMLNQVERINPNVICQVGDIMDFYSFSRFPASLNVATPRREVKEGKWMAGEMWATLKGLAPKAQCFQLHGNHEDRPFKMMLRSAPALEEILQEPFQNLLKFPGVTTMDSSMDELEINGIRFIHGWSCRPGYHMGYFMANTAHGHTHHGGVTYLRLNNKTIWELDAGILANYMARPMIYRSTVTTKWTPGFGIIDELGPRFCPL